jgi:hypothetical protein
LKYHGGDSGIKISVLYWRCSLITVSVIRGATVCECVCVYIYIYILFSSTFKPIMVAIIKTVTLGLFHEQEG